MKVKRIIISSGRNTDIDVLACAVTYAELLTKEGKKALAVPPGFFNKSITREVKRWNFKYEKLYEPNPSDVFVVVDLSEPDYIAKFVKQDRILELFDHHFGYEEYWQKKLGEKAKIEKVGACATLIWEEYKKRIRPLEISTASANLLYTAIVSNTLNFKASVTNKRDIDAFEEIAPFTKLFTNWIEKYFEDQEAAVAKNPVEEIRNDTHIESFPDSDETLIIGQVELWDSRKFFKNHKKDIKVAMESFAKPYWFLTSPSISEGKNYIYCENQTVQKMLAEKLEIKFVNDAATTKKLLLRKEIKKVIYNLSSN
jgi:inorganic pyrophosphatase/exopolyphosphatase